MADNDHDIPNPKEMGYAIEISESLYRKIDKLIHIFNKLDDQSYSKQSWVLEAIKEKLVTEGENNDVPKVKFLKLQMSPQINQKIEEKVSLYKQFRTSYSKKKWLLEAIYEKKLEEKKDRQINF